MGYTHYWNQRRDIPVKAWYVICADVRALIEKLPEKTDTAGGFYKDEWLRVGFESDSNERALVDEKQIRFNGLGVAQEKRPHVRDDLGHETFLITRKKRPIESWEDLARYRRVGAGDFCKTSRKPYDLLVCAVLLVVLHHADGAFTVGSDGGPSDWQPAIAFANGVLARSHPNPINEEAA